MAGLHVDAVVAARELGQDQVGHLYARADTDPAIGDDGNMAQDRAVGQDPLVRLAHHGIYAPGFEVGIKKSAVPARSTFLDFFPYAVVVAAACPLAMLWSAPGSVTVTSYLRQ